MLKKTGRPKLPTLTTGGRKEERNDRNKNEQDSYKMYKKHIYR